MKYNNLSNLIIINRLPFGSDNSDSDYLLYLQFKCKYFKYILSDIKIKIKKKRIFEIVR